VKFIVGLGNPGKRYADTRHNIGFLVLDELARREGITFRRSMRFSARQAKGGRVRLIQPLTFMNRSGGAVAALLKKSGGTPEDLMVVFDDVALPWGDVRIRARGSAGGHNGLTSVIQCLGSEAFARIRVGIGSKPDKLALSDYVLAPFSAQERKILPDVVQRAADAVEAVWAEGVEWAMNRFNGGVE